MPHISRKRLDKATYTQVLDVLDLLLGKLKKEEVRLFLYSLMSGTERLMVAKRFAAIVLVKQGYSDSEISERLKITRSTIGKLKLIMQVKNSGFELANKKLQQEKLMKDIKNLLIEIAGEMGSNSLIKHSKR